MEKTKIIKINSEFEEQNILTEYELDFNKASEYKIIFSDGYYVTVNDKIEHILNDDAVEANLFTSDSEKKSTTWVSSKKADEVEYTLFNWFMELKLIGNNVYKLIFKRGRPVCGGFL